jgi:hypothetical protein
VRFRISGASSEKPATMTEWAGFPLRIAVPTQDPELTAAQRHLGQHEKALRDGAGGAEIYELD